MPFDEDLTVFFDVDDFADVATFQPADGRQSFTVNGIFDDEYQLRQARDVEHETTRPQLLCMSADVAAVKREDACVIRGKTYGVLAVEPDGTGISRVVLVE